MQLDAHSTKAIPIRPPMTGNNQSDGRLISDTISLRAYVTALQKAANATLPALTNINEPGQRIIKELLDAGLVSDLRSKFGFIELTCPVVLTPAGAHALVEWSDYLWRNTWQYKVGGAFVRFLWIAVGAVCASLPGWLN